MGDAKLIEVNEDDNLTVEDTESIDSKVLKDVIKVYDNKRAR